MDANPNPEPERATVAAVLLAAGMSSRFAAGQPKQLLSLGGETLIHRALRLVLEASENTTEEAPVICLVLGHAAEEVRAAIDDLLAEAPRVVCLYNTDYALGQSTSVRCSVKYLQTIEGVSAAYFLPIDQPWMTVSLLRRLVAVHDRNVGHCGGGQGDGKIVVPSCGGRVGSPVLFDRVFFPELLQLEGDQGGRQILRRHRDHIHVLELDDEAPLHDIDTLDDIEGLEPPLPQS